MSVVETVNYDLHSIFLTTLKCKSRCKSRSAHAEAIFVENFKYRKTLQIFGEVNQNTVLINVQSKG